MEFWKTLKDIKPKGISAEKLAAAVRMASRDIQRDSVITYGIWEWRATEDDTDPVNSNRWRQIEAVPVEGETWEQTDAMERTRQSALRTTRLDWESDADILREISQDGFPAVIATDGGHIETLEGPSRTAASVTLCSSDLSSVGEDNLWHEETCTPRLVRICVLPRQVGAADTDNDQAELLALNMAEELLPVECPAILITDSEAVRIKYLTIRDETSKSGRSLIRRTYSGVSKMLATRLARNIQLWSMRSCPKLEQMVSDLKPLISTNRDGPWREEYWDDHSFRVILKVDSHQIDSKGKSLKRYKTITPCKWMVTANQLADDGASTGIGTLSSSATRTISEQTPNNLRDGEGLRFYFTHNGKRLDKDTPREIYKIVSDEMNRRACTVPSQGLLSRALPYTTRSSKAVGTRSNIRRVSRHLAASHTRSMYKNTDYARRSILAVNHVLEALKLPIPTEATVKGKVDARYLQCPFCIEIQNGSESVGRGTIHHYHIFCRHPIILASREKLHDILEEGARDFWSEIIDKVGHRRGNDFRTDLKRRLQELEMESAQAMSSQCRQQSRVANISIIDDNEAMEPRRESYRLARERWPLCCAFGFITARREKEIDDATASAVDLTHVGILPDCLQVWADSTIAAAVQHGGATGLMAKSQVRSLRDKWDRVVALNFMKADCLQRVIREQIGKRAKQLRQQEEKEQKEAEELKEAEEEEADPDSKPSATIPRAVAARRDTHPNRCCGTKCQYFQDIGEEIRMYWLVKDKSSCPYCTAFDKVERMVTAAENAIADCTYREEINRIDEIRKMPASQRLNAIIHFAVKLVDNESIWPKPKKNKSNQYQQALRDAARHLANSILVELPDRHSGPDEPLSKERMLALNMKAKAICTGECDMDLMDCDEDDAIILLELLSLTIVLHGRVVLQDMHPRHQGGRLESMLRMHNSLVNGEQFNETANGSDQGESGEAQV